MEQIINKINALSANGFKDEDCKSFTSEFSIPILIDAYINNDDLSPADIVKLENTIDELLKHPSIFADLFFNPDNKSNAVKVITCDDETILAIVTGAIYYHRNLILDVISANLIKEETVDNYLDVLFYLFMSDATSAYACVLKILTFLSASAYGNQLFSQPTFLRHLNEGLDSAYSIVKARTFELIVQLSHLKKLEELFYESGLIGKAFSLYAGSKNDILEKLNLIELTKQFTYSARAMEILKSTGLVDEFKTEAFNNSTELYIRRDLLVILCHMHREFLLDYDEAVMNRIYAIVAEWLMSPKEDKNAGYDLGLVFFNCEENLVKLTHDHSLLQILLATSNMKEHHLLKCLQLQSSLMTENKSMLRQRYQRPITDHEFKKLLIIFYHPNHLVKGDWTKEDLLCAMENLLNACQIPFDDIELNHLSIFEKLMTFDDLVFYMPEIPAIEGFLLYLKFKGAKGEIVLHRKSELLRKLKGKLATFLQTKAEMKERIGWMIDIINSKGPTLEFNLANESAS
jgi:hypothetical protein